MKYAMRLLFFTLAFTFSCTENKEIHNQEKQSLENNTVVITKDTLIQKKNSIYKYCDDLLFVGDTNLYQVIRKLLPQKLQFISTSGEIEQKASLFIGKNHKDSCILLYETTNHTLQKSRIMLMKMQYMVPSELGSDLGEDDEGNAFAIHSYVYSNDDVWVEMSVSTDNKYLFVITASNDVNDKRTMFCRELPGDTKRNLKNIKM